MKDKEAVGVLTHGGKVDVYAIGVTMTEMCKKDKLNKRNVWDRKFSNLLAGMKRVDPETRLSVRQVQKETSELLDGPTGQCRDQFGCLPMSKRAMELIDSAIIATSRARESTSPKKSRRTRASPSSNKATSKRASPSPKKPRGTRAKKSSKRSAKRKHELETTPICALQTIVPLITEANLPIVEAVPYPTRDKKTASPEIQDKIDRAAEAVCRSGKTRGIYKPVLMQFGLNLDSKGNYLGSNGKEYGLLQTAVRTLRRRLTNEALVNNTGAATKLEQVTNNTSCMYITTLIHRSVQSHIGC